MTDVLQVSASVEDYLEAIYHVVQKNQVALPRDIRKILNVGRSSVSGALRHLVKLDLIRHESYGVITLTKQGEAIASEVVRKHTILKDFFVTVLGVNEQDADSAACAMEHVINGAVLEQFLEYANRSVQETLKEGEPKKVGGTVKPQNKPSA